MWYHQLKAALRQMGKNKFFTIVHISGLAIGISAALIVYIMVSHELSYNKGIIGNERVYRIVSDIQYPDMLIKNGGVPAPLGRVVGGEVPGIEASTAMFQFYEPRVTLPAPSGQSQKVLLSRPQVSFVDATYFGFVPHEWLAGSPATALTNPNTVVLSREVMDEYFPGWQPEQVIGQVLTYEDDLRVTVSGIVNSKAGNHSFQVSEMISMPTIVAADLTSNYSWDRWDNINSASQLLVRLLPNTSAEALPGQLAVLQKKYHPDEKYKNTLGVQPLSDVHFNSDYQAFYARVAHKPTLYGLMLVALFLLLLGCINFINLSTAQSAQRAREIGIRKTLGSSRWQLTKQFLSETWLLTIAAVLLALLAGPALLKLFRDFIPNDIDASLLYQRGVVLFLCVLSVVVTLLAGLYPSWVLNRVMPVAVLKNQVVTSDGQSRKAMLRKVLIVFSIFYCAVLPHWGMGSRPTNPLWHPCRYGFSYR
jgi:putative ABC transport system permease protein